jgi:hypothetical protein
MKHRHVARQVAVTIQDPRKARIWFGYVEHAIEHLFALWSGQIARDSVRKRPATKPVWHSLKQYWKDFLDDLTDVRLFRIQHRALQQVRQFNNFLPQSNQALTNRLVQDAPIQLLKCA